MVEVVELSLRRGVGVLLLRHTANRIDARPHDGARIDSAPQRDTNRDDARQPPSARASPGGEEIYRDDEGQASRDVSEDVITRKHHAYDFPGVGAREHRENHWRGEK